MSEGIAPCEQLLTETADRSGTANVLVFLAGLQALAERFDEALQTLDDADAILRELGETYALANNSGRIRGRILLFHAELGRAESVFLDCYRTFEGAGDEAALSSLASRLALTLCEQSRQSEALEWIAIAEVHAPSRDIEAQLHWRAAAGRVRAESGDYDAGHRLAFEAVAIVERTDVLTDHGDVLVQLAHVLRAGDRHGEAVAAIERALALFDRKEDAASARRARSLLAEFAVA